MPRNALVVRGGWDGHAPVAATELFIPKSQNGVVRSKSLVFPSSSQRIWCVENRKGIYLVRDEPQVVLLAEANILSDG